MSGRGGHRCCIANCLSTSSVNRGVKETLFRFPKDAERSALWVNACNRNDLLSKKPMELYNNYRVCRLHFEKKMFLNYERTRLQPHAVPSCTISDNNEETDPNSSDVTVHSIDTQNLEENEVDLVCSHNELNEMVITDEINLTEIDRICLEQSEIKSCTTSDTEMQTDLLLSPMSPQERKLYQRIKKYKKKIAELEAKMQQIHDLQGFDALDVLLNKYFPKETANFLKMQARLFQKRNKSRSSPHL